MRRSIPALLGLAVLSFGTPAQESPAKLNSKPVTTHPAGTRQQAKVRAARLEYAARSRALAAHDVVGHFALAQWCVAKKLPRCARWELHEVLREAPDHVGARSMMGQVFHRGRWLPLDVARRAKGLVQIDAGRWVRKYDAVRARSERRHRLSVQHAANLLFARLADRNPTIRAAAGRALSTLAEREKLPHLRELAHRRAAEYDAFWRTHRRAYTAYAGLISVAATHATLEGMDTFTTSLGAGAPVRLQLPRMRTVSIRTTVDLPLGFGH